MTIRFHKTQGGFTLSFDDESAHDLRVALGSTLELVASAMPFFDGSDLREIEHARDTLQHLKDVLSD